MGSSPLHRGYERRGHGNSFFPPPSPIPTATGLRSAAADDEILNAYFTNNIHIPYLMLPESTTVAYRTKLPARIDFRLLTSRVENSIERLISSTREFGVVRIAGHGVSQEEVAAVKAAVEVFFRRLDERKSKFWRSFVERVGNREEFVWFRSDKAMLLWVREVMGPDKYRDFSRKMENLVRKLDRIAEELAEIFSKYSFKRFEKVIEEGESIITLYRYNDMHPCLLLSNEDIHQSYEHALSLHLAVAHGEFYVQADKGPLSFSADPDTIIVTVGTQLMEWSAGDFRSVSGEVIFDPNLHGSNASYSIELKCSPLNLNFGYTKKVIKTISLVDQVLIVLLCCFLCNIFLFLISRPTGIQWLSFPH